MRKRGTTNEELFWNYWMKKFPDGIYVKETTFFNIFKSEMKERVCKRESHDEITFTSSPIVGTRRVIAFASK